jgi:hypothetical protein
VRGSDNNVLRRNTIGPALVFNGFPNSGGIALCEANGTTVAMNTITGMYVGIGVGTDSSCPSEALTGTVIQNNTVTGSSGAGLFVEESGDGITLSSQATRTILSNNTVTKNQHNGITAPNPSVTLTQNTALGNGGFGIAAAVGAIDGGGNIARNNGARPQCTGVVCR